MTMDREPKDPTEALAMALTLAIVADDDEKAQQAVDMAEGIAAQFGLSEIQVAQAKRDAQRMAAEWDTE